MEIVKKIKSTPKSIWILLAIVLIGIFLRTYNFRSWLVFNPDQARDAILIESALQSPANFPLLGPEAGNTHFSLGPIFYWFEYVSVKVFGNSPEALAFPDVLFSILTIILFYFFVKKYFSVNISLALTGLLSVSFFAVRYSRFAMNTNSIPFWTLLFLLGILNLLDEKNYKKIIWPILVGISLGIGIQLHALLLISMPILALIFLALIIKRRTFTWKNLMLIIFFFLLVNIGQIIYDVENNGANSALFISSVANKSGGNNLLRNFGMNFMYQFQANAHMLSSSGDENEPIFIKTANRILKNKSPYQTLSSKIIPFLEIFLSALFSIIGYFLLGYFFHKEKERRKKDFLLIISLYSIIMFLLMIPIIQEASIRYFIVLLFLPFIFLGLWMRFFFEKNKKMGSVFSIFIVTILLFSNLSTIKASANKYQSQIVNNIDNSILGEDEIILNYLFENSGSAKEVYLTGKNLYLIRFYKPLSYLAQERGMSIVRIFSDKEIERGIPLFYIKDSEEKNKLAGELYKNYIIKDVKKYKNIMILHFEN